MSAFSTTPFTSALPVWTLLVLKYYRLNTSTRFSLTLSLFSDTRWALDWFSFTCRSNTQSLRNNTTISLACIYITQSSHQRLIQITGGLGFLHWSRDTSNPIESDWIINQRWLAAHIHHFHAFQNTPSYFSNLQSICRHTPWSITINGMMDCLNNSYLIQTICIDQCLPWIWSDPFRLELQPLCNHSSSFTITINAGPTANYLIDTLHRLVQVRHFTIMWDYCRYPPCPISLLVKLSHWPPT